MDFFNKLHNVLEIVKSSKSKIMKEESIARFRRFMIHNGNVAWAHQYFKTHKNKLFTIIKNCNVDKSIYEYMLFKMNLSEPEIQTEDVEDLVSERFIV